MAFLFDTRVAVENKTAMPYERMIAGFKHTRRVMRHALAHRTQVDQHDPMIVAPVLKGPWIIQDYVEMIALVTRGHQQSRART